MEWNGAPKCVLRGFWFGLVAGLETSRDPLLDATENAHAYAESLAVRRGEAYAPPF